MHGTFQPGAQKRPVQPGFNPPLPPELKSDSAAPISCKRRTQSEISDDCESLVALLNPKLRVIAGSCGMQWLLQSRAPSQWRNVAYCATREGMLLRIRDHLQSLEPKARAWMSLRTLAHRHCRPPAWAIIEALPDVFPKAAA